MTDTERTEKAIEKLNEIGKIVAFLKTDDETYSAGEDLDKIQQDLIRFFSALLQQPQPSAGEIKEFVERTELHIKHWGNLRSEDMVEKLGQALIFLTAQAQTIAEQGIRLDTVNRIGKEACEELDQLQNENTEQTEEIKGLREENYNLKTRLDMCRKLSQEHKKRELKNAEKCVEQAEQLKQQRRKLKEQHGIEYI